MRGADCIRDRTRGVKRTDCIVFLKSTNQPNIPEFLFTGAARVLFAIPVRSSPVRTIPIAFRSCVCIRVSGVCGCA